MLIHGDCVEVLKTIESDSVDLILTDPPFNVNLEYNSLGDGLEDYAYRDWCLLWLKECHRVLKDRHAAIIFSGDAKLYYVHDAIMKSGLFYNHMFKWIKPNSSRNFATTTRLLNKVELAFFCSKNKFDKKLMTGTLTTDYIICNVINSKSKEALTDKDLPNGHVAQRPVGLYANIIKGLTKEGDTVLDSFLGSGTTAEACELTNRKWIGIEKDEVYIKKIEKRLSKKEKFFD